MYQHGYAGEKCGKNSRFQWKFKVRNYLSVFVSILGSIAILKPQLHVHFFPWIGDMIFLKSLHRQCMVVASVPMTNFGDKMLQQLKTAQDSW